MSTSSSSLLGAGIVSCSFLNLLKRYRLPQRLASVDDVLALIDCILRRETEPCLAQLSIMFGDIEHRLTSGLPATESTDEANSDVYFSELDLAQLDRLSDSFTVYVFNMRFDLTKHRTRIEQELVLLSNSSNNNTDSAALSARLKKLDWSSVDLRILQLPGCAWFAELLRHVIVQIADLIWYRLRHSVGLAELTHCQSLYSLVNSGPHHPPKLDTFGVCLAVVAACQLLDVPTVRLALSEDHAWLVFGDQLEHSAEISWAGRGLQSLRGQSVLTSETASGVGGSGGASVHGTSNSWLYLNGNPVVCETHWLTMVAMVTSISPRMTGLTAAATAEHQTHQQHHQLHHQLQSKPLATLKQRLLWQLYDFGHLKCYPLALINLADLEAASPTPRRRDRLNDDNVDAGYIDYNQYGDIAGGSRDEAAVALYNEAIRANLVYYNNSHVYPYLALGGYFYRRNRCRPALRYWCLAARTVAQYSYSREDAEIYKELFEVSNELIPHLLRSAGESVSSDAHSLAALLHFYDAICLWEQDSNTPVLHVGWADRIVNCLLRFNSVARQRLRVACCFAADKNDDQLSSDGCSSHEGGAVNDDDPVSLRTVAKGCASALLNPHYLLGLSSTVFLVDCPASNSPAHSTYSTASSTASETVPVSLRSRKMSGIAALFCQARLNGAAIKLQLTAQSQVQFKRHQQQQQQSSASAGSASSGESARAKRLRFRSGSDYCV